MSAKIKLYSHSFDDKSIDKDIVRSHKRYYKKKYNYYKRNDSTSILGIGDEKKSSENIFDNISKSNIVVVNKKQITDIKRIIAEIRANLNTLEQLITQLSKKSERPTVNTSQNSQNNKKGKIHKESDNGRIKPTPDPIRHNLPKNQTMEVNTETWLKQK